MDHSANTVTINNMKLRLLMSRYQPFSIAPVSSHRTLGWLEFEFLEAGLSRADNDN